MTSLKQYLDGQKLLDKVALPTRLAALLSTLQIVEASPGDTGHVQGGVDAKPLLLDLALRPGGPVVPYSVIRSSTGFSLVLDQDADTRR